VGTRLLVLVTHGTRAGIKVIPRCLLDKKILLDWSHYYWIRNISFSNRQAGLKGTQERIAKPTLRRRRLGRSGNEGYRAEPGRRAAPSEARGTPRFILFFLPNQNHPLDTQVLSIYRKTVRNKRQFHFCQHLFQALPTVGVPSIHLL